MTNVRTEIEDGELIIRVNLNETHGPSRSGKTIIVASTHGFVSLDNGIGVSLNVTKPRS